MLVTQCKLFNHTIRQRMGRELLRQVDDCLSGRQHPVDPLVSEMECDHDQSVEDVDMSVCMEACDHPAWESEVRFFVDPPFDTSATPSEKNVECFMFDYGKATRTPRKAKERFKKFFSMELGYNA